MDTPKAKSWNSNGRQRRKEAFQRCVRSSREVVSGEAMCSPQRTPHTGCGEAVTLCCCLDALDTAATNVRRGSGASLRSRRPIFHLLTHCGVTMAVTALPFPLEHSSKAQAHVCGGIGRIRLRLSLFFSWRLEPLPMMAVTSVQ